MNQRHQGQFQQHLYIPSFNQLSCSFLEVSCCCICLQLSYALCHTAMRILTSISSDVWSVMMLCCMSLFFCTSFYGCIIIPPPACVLMPGCCLTYRIFVYAYTQIIQFPFSPRKRTTQGLLPNSGLWNCQGVGVEIYVIYIRLIHGRLACMGPYLCCHACKSLLTSLASLAVCFYTCACMQMS